MAWRKPRSVGSEEAMWVCALDVSAATSVESCPHDQMPFLTLHLRLTHARVFRLYSSSTYILQVVTEPSAFTECPSCFRKERG